MWPTQTPCCGITTPKLVEAAYSVLYKVFSTDRLSKEKTHGVRETFWQETGHRTEQSGSTPRSGEQVTTNPEAQLKRRSGPQHDDIRTLEIGYQIDTSPKCETVG